jgi:hypothetical protein
MMELSFPPGLRASGMASQPFHRLRNLALACVFGWTIGITAAAQTTAFTFQGRLQREGVPAVGSYDLRFTLYDAVQEGNSLGPVLTNSAVDVNGGLFAVPLDFGNEFSGSHRWVEIAVRTNGGDGFQTLAPRQPITATPYAWRAAVATSAQTADTAATAVSAASMAASNLLGILSTAQLPAGVAYRSGGNDFSGTQTITGRVGIGTNTPRASLHIIGGLVAGGTDNVSESSETFATIAGGFGNAIGLNNPGSFLGAGSNNRILAGSGYSAVVGGFNNIVRDSAPQSFIGGGGGNLITTNSSVSAISGGYYNSIQYFSPFSIIGGGANNQVLPSSSFAVIAGGEGNLVGTNSATSTISGGSYNAIQSFANSSTISGGAGNKIATQGYQSVIAGGGGNEIGTNAFQSAVGGGFGHRIATNASRSVISGGYANLSEGEYATIGGGGFNVAGGFAATVAGGWGNRAAANGAVIPGGGNNTASGVNSFAAGSHAVAQHFGAFVWADSLTGDDYFSQADHTFNVRARGGTVFSTESLRVSNGTTNGNLSLQALDGGNSGFHAINFNGGFKAGEFRYNTSKNRWRVVVDHRGAADVFQIDTFNGTDGGLQVMTVLTNGNVGFANSNPTNRLMVANARCDGSSWINASDRNLKQDFAPVDPLAVLEKVVSLPIETWSYTEQPLQRHLGPVAQDFHDAFGLGQDDTSIATVDADGVALAAIQGLNRKLERENAELRSELAELKRLMTKLASQLEVEN